MGKRAFIKDPLWGNIELFSWESNLTNHFILNRLGNIVQNSSAYRAYPGLKYSRFLHTIGVVHVSTQLFVNATNNAEPNLLAEFRKEAKKAERNLTSDQIAFLENQLVAHLGEHTKFASLLATLRMCAFIHDLGHLPFSHVFENAMESFISPAIEKTITITKKVKQIRDELKDVLKDHSPEYQNGVKTKEPDKIHERLGLQLAKGLARELNEEENENARLASSLIHTAIELLTKNDFPITESFIKGTVDADRIDFTRRDGHFSGLFSSSVDYGRLFSLYTLQETEEDGSKAIVAGPHSRAVSETEKLLWERFQDYKYIVMHHKVHFYDEIVENVLIRLLSSGRLNDFLKDLIDLLKKEPEGHNSIKTKHDKFRLLESILLEFDDPWIESHIRSIYRKVVEDPKREKTRDEETDILFQVYVEDRKRFTSVFKSDDEFWDAVKHLAPRFHSLRPKEDCFDQDSMDKRGFFSNALYTAKFSLQEVLKKELKCCVIIGPTDRKVSYGVRNDDLARFYHISKLVNFLKQKKYDTMLFNLWFDTHSGMSKKDFMAKALPIIQDVIFSAVDAKKGITELGLKS